MDLGDAKWGFSLGYGIALTTIFTVIGFSANAGANVSTWATQTQNAWNYVPIIFLAAVIFMVAYSELRKRDDGE